MGEGAKKPTARDERDRKQKKKEGESNKKKEIVFDPFRKS